MGHSGSGRVASRCAPRLLCEGVLFSRARRRRRCGSALLSSDCVAAAFRAGQCSSFPAQLCLHTHGGRCLPLPCGDGAHNACCGGRSGRRAFAAPDSSCRANLRYDATGPCSASALQHAHSLFAAGVRHAAAVPFRCTSILLRHWCSPAERVLLRALLRARLPRRAALPACAFRGCLAAAYPALLRRLRLGRYAAERRCSSKRSRQRLSGGATASLSWRSASSS